MTDEPGFRPETHSTVDEDALWEAVRAGQPWQTDISDYSDEWCAGFIEGQRNVADDIASELEVLRRERDEWEERWHEIETKVLCHDDALARAEAAEAEVERLRAALERIAGRYCLHSKGDVREASACLDKPSDQWCSVCVARAALSREDA
jgi:hypothetical protein